MYNKIKLYYSDNGAPALLFNDTIFSLEIENFERIKTILGENDINAFLLNHCLDPDYKEERIPLKLDDAITQIKLFSNIDKRNKLKEGAEFSIFQRKEKIIFKTKTHEFDLMRNYHAIDNQLKSTNDSFLILNSDKEIIRIKKSEFRELNTYISLKYDFRKKYLYKFIKNNLEKVRNNNKEKNKEQIKKNKRKAKEKKQYSNGY